METEWKFRMDRKGRAAHLSAWEFTILVTVRANEHEVNLFAAEYKREMCKQRNTIEQ